MCGEGMWAWAGAGGVGGGVKSKPAEQEVIGPRQRAHRAGGQGWRGREQLGSCMEAAARPHPGGVRKPGREGEPVEILKACFPKGTVPTCGTGVGA